MVGNANANGIPFLKRYGIPPAIKNSMVLWYDIARQGATNESMAENPTLKDLSGNGHDITCYNFAWFGMSGIGGYVYDLISSKYSTVSNNIATIISNEGAVGGSIITIPKQQIKGEKGKTLTYTRKAFDVKISNLPVGVDIQVNFGKNNGNTTKWEIIGYFVNGINHVDEEVITVEPYDSESTPYINDCRILLSNKLAGVENIADLGITIELLPEYPNALVSDGVDDYAYVEGLPILTDYTVIAKREWIKIEYTDYAALAGKTKSFTGGAFIFERRSSDNNDHVYNFGTSNIVDIGVSKYTYQTSSTYNGSNIYKGSLIDDDCLSLFSDRAGAHPSQIALYSFLLFNRTLTADEIEWVKTNLISVSTNE